MNATCNDRDRIFEDGTPAEWAALETHAANCAVCAEELRAWKALSTTSQELRDYSETPSLWPRIERALAEEATAKMRRAERWGWLSSWGRIPIGWQTALSGAFALILTVSLGWVILRPTHPPSGPSPLLKTSALAEVERTEKAYEQAIDKLAAEAKPQLENPDTPLLANYREKLLVIDNAIDDLRAQAGQNPSNAHLRGQLLAMYQEKQQTLQDLLEEKR